MEIDNVPSAVQILEEKGYKIKDQGNGNYEIFANSLWYSAIRKKLPIVGRIYGEQFYPIKVPGTMRRQMRCNRHNKIIKKLLKLEDL